MTPWHLMIIAAAGCSIWMALTWLIAMKINFLSLVDAAWSFGIGLCALGFAILAGAHPVRSIVAAGMAILWSLRLGGFLTLRLAQHFPTEDTRYQTLRQNFTQGFAVKTFLFFQLQAAIQVVLAYPFAALALDNGPFPRLAEVMGIILYGVGLIGESVADAQLKKFKAQSAHSPKPCNTGLWRYSRHPNYFFEWIIWCGISVTALGSPDGVYALICPALMLFLLLFVTGVRPSEQQALKSKGQAYRDYQAVTSVFIPWPPRSGEHR